MGIWALFAFANAVSNSVYNAVAKQVVSLKHYSQYTITIWGALLASFVLFAANFALGFPEIDSRFWAVSLTTGVLNGIASPLMLKAYDLGVFSSVYSKILLTPVFMLLTSFLLLGEQPSLLGIFGVLLTVCGLWVISGKNIKSEPKAIEGVVSVLNETEKKKVKDLRKAELLGILVAFIYSISVNYDKLSAAYSNAVFAPAVSFVFVALTNIAYLLIVRKPSGIIPTERHALSHVRYLLLVGAILGGSSILHNLALLNGPAAYTIAIKRIAVLFGVFWGWRFFKEKEVGRKALGALVAVLGVLMIIFA